MYDIWWCILYANHTHAYMYNIVQKTLVHNDPQRFVVHTFIHTYIHACMHTYIHTYKNTDMHACIHTYIRTYVHTYMHTYIHTYIYIYTYIYIHTYMYIYIFIYIYTYIFVDVKQSLISLLSWYQTIIVYICQMIIMLSLGYLSMLFSLFP